MTMTPEQIDALPGLVERLRDADATSVQRSLGSRIFGEAADALETLAAEVLRLRAAEQAAADRGAEVDALVAAPSDLGHEWMRRACVEAVEVNADEPNDAIDAILAIPGPTPEQLLAEARRLPEVAALVEALRFYGDVSKYPAPLTGGCGALWMDCGETARDALAALKGGAA